MAAFSTSCFLALGVPFIPANTNLPLGLSSIEQLSKLPLAFPQSPSSLNQQTLCDTIPKEELSLPLSCFQDSPQVLPQRIVWVSQGRPPSCLMSILIEKASKHKRICSPNVVTSSVGRWLLEGFIFPFPLIFFY